MHTTTLVSRLALAAVLALTIAACGSDGAEDEPSSHTPFRQTALSNTAFSKAASARMCHFKTSGSGQEATVELMTVPAGHQARHAIHGDCFCDSGPSADDFNMPYRLCNEQFDCATRQDRNRNGMADGCEDPTASE